jgi:hypothetical protein
LGGKRARRVWPSTDNYGIPYEKIVAVVHGEYDIQHFLAQRPLAEIDRFGSCAVISKWLSY